MRALRLVREEEPSGYPKASLLLRAGARIVDVMIAWALYVSLGPAGVVLAPRSCAISASAMRNMSS